MLVKDIYSIKSKELFSILEDKTTKSYKYSEKIVQLLYDTIYNNAQNDINLDFADVVCVTASSDMVSLYQAKLDDNTLFELKHILHDTSNLLIIFKMHPSYPLMKIADFVCEVQKLIDEEALIIFGTHSDDNMSENSLEMLMLLNSSKDDRDSIL